MTHPHTRGLFVTSTGTSAGKTFVTRAVAGALRASGIRVAAVKPIETGCAPYPADALKLAVAAGDPTLAAAPVYYRAELPLAPYAVELATGCAAPDLPRITAHLAALRRSYQVVLIEAAGGLLVPVSREETMAEFARALGDPLLLVAPDTLGVLSHALTAFEAASTRGLAVAAIVLTQLEPTPSEPSHLTNARILAERTGRPVIRFPYVVDDDAALAAAARESGLLTSLQLA